MAIAKPLIFEEIEITDEGGANGTSFQQHLVESAEVTPEPATSMIDDGQTLTDHYDTEFSVNLYDLAVLADARVYDDASAEPQKCDIIFKKANGAVTLTISGVILNGTRVYDGNRTQARLFGSKRSVKIDDTVVES